MTAVRPAVPVPIRLPEEVLAQVDERLTATDALLTPAYPGDDARRQPVHTVYVPADQYTTDLPHQWGSAAAAWSTSTVELSGCVPTSACQTIWPARWRLR